MVEPSPTLTCTAPKITMSTIADKYHLLGSPTTSTSFTPTASTYVPTSVFGGYIFKYALRDTLGGIAPTWTSIDSSGKVTISTTDYSLVGTHTLDYVANLHRTATSAVA